MHINKRESALCKTSFWTTFLSLLFFPNFFNHNPDTTRRAPLKHYTMINTFKKRAGWKTAFFVFFVSVNLFVSSFYAFNRTMLKLNHWEKTFKGSTLYRVIYSLLFLCFMFLVLLVFFLLFNSSEYFRRCTEDLA